jgi:hypothetical protein
MKTILCLFIFAMLGCTPEPPPPNTHTSAIPLGCSPCSEAQEGTVKTLWCDGTIHCPIDSQTVVCDVSTPLADLRVSGCLPVDGAIDGMSPACCGGKSDEQNDVVCSQNWDGNYACMQTIETGETCWYGRCMSDGFCGLGPFPNTDFPNDLCDDGMKSCVRQITDEPRSVVCQ